MIDAVQDFRISALERALASLTGADVTAQQPAPAPPVAQPVAAPAPRPAGASHDNARIAALESAVLALTNSVTLLNQQMTGLATELQKQTNAQNMITITPTATVDAAQDARLDGIDTLLQSLAQNVADYNNQMTTLISQYQSLHPKPRAAPKTAANNFGLKTA